MISMGATEFMRRARAGTLPPAMGPRQIIQPGAPDFVRNAAGPDDIVLYNDVDPAVIAAQRARAFHADAPAPILPTRPAPWTYSKKENSKMSDFGGGDGMFVMDGFGDGDGMFNLDGGWLGDDAQAAVDKSEAPTSGGWLDSAFSTAVAEAKKIQESKPAPGAIITKTESQVRADSKKDSFFTKEVDLGGMKFPMWSLLALGGGLALVLTTGKR